MRKAVFVLILFVICCNCEAALPTGEDIGNRLQSAKNAYKNFYDDSLTQLASYHYNGLFNREGLQNTAKNFVAEMDRIIKRQKDYLKAIEDYEGDDWDGLFGQTGLYRKLKSGITTSYILRADIYYHYVFNIDKTSRKSFCQKVLNTLEEIDDPFTQLLKVRIVLLCNSKQAKELFEQLDKQAFADNINLQAEYLLLNYEFTGRTEPEEISKLFYGKISIYNKLRLAFLYNKLKNESLLKELARKSYFKRSLKAVFYNDIIRRYENGKDITDVSPFFAVTASQRLRNNKDPQAGIEVFNKLASLDKFLDMALLLNIAHANKDISPVIAARQYIVASNIVIPEMPKWKVKQAVEQRLGCAETASVLAGNVANADNMDTVELAIEAFENYIALAERYDKDIKADYHYNYIKLLLLAGKEENAKGLLKDFVAAPDSDKKVFNRMLYDLVTLEMKGGIEDKQVKEKIVRQLEGLVNDALMINDDLLYKNSVILLGRILLADDGQVGAERFLDIAGDGESLPEIEILKAKALHDVGRYEVALENAVGLIDENPDDMPEIAIYILRSIFEFPEKKYHFAKDEDAFMQNCYLLAEYCYDNPVNPTYPGMWPQSQAKWRSHLYLEICGFAGNMNEKADEICQRIGMSHKRPDVFEERAMGRYAFAKGDYESAGKSWVKISNHWRREIRNSEYYWQGRYNEFLCLSKMDGQREKLEHAVEVINKSGVEIPEFWLKMINLLVKKVGTAHPTEID